MASLAATLAQQPWGPERVLTEVPALPNCEELKTLYKNRLYHEFTHALEKSLKSEELTVNDAVIVLYHVATKPVLGNINQQQLIALLQWVVLDRHQESASLNVPDVSGVYQDRQVKGPGPVAPGPDSSVEWPALVKLVEHFEGLGVFEEEPLNLLKIVKARILVRMCDIPQADVILFEDITKGYLTERVGISIDFNASFHLACAEFYKAKGEDRKLYDSLLLHLAYIDLNAISENRLRTLGRELCVAGLVAESMFDFGVLLASPVVLQLPKEDAFLLELIRAGAEGDLDRFKAVLNNNSSDVERLIGDKLITLKQKMTLAAFMDLAFLRNMEDLAPEDIALVCDVPLEEVDLLIIRAIALGLIRGKIDGETGLLKVTWLKPRIVEKQRVDMIKQRFIAWADSVGNVASFLESTAEELMKSTGVVLT